MYKSRILVEHNLYIYHQTTAYIVVYICKLSPMRARLNKLYQHLPCTVSGNCLAASKMAVWSWILQIEPFLVCFKVQGLNSRSRSRFIDKALQGAWQYMYNTRRESNIQIREW